MSSSGLASLMFPIEKSDIYSLVVAERREIDRLKWILSERAGEDVGLIYTEWFWAIYCRDAWRAALPSGSSQKI